MRTRGRFLNAGRDLQGNLTFTFTVESEAVGHIDTLQDKELILDITKYSEKRSLNANAYFWKLCDMIAQRLRSDKDTIYLIQLSKYGVFVDVEITREALPTLKDKFRYVQEFNDGYNTDTIIARCYFGSSQYTKAEMHALISGTVEDAHDLGITTFSDEEVNRLVQEWKGATQ